MGCTSLLLNMNYVKLSELVIFKRGGKILEINIMYRFTFVHHCIIKNVVYA